ncbi:hypothetical protein GF406_06750 [candidate division KSB1 bacterium]|nr:hypothetical protein [candidate division KSB1 bacterium]
MMRYVRLILLILTIGVSLGFAQFQVKTESGTVIMKVTTNGNVGIGLGTATPASTLDVSGTIRFRSLVKGSLTYPVLTVDADGNLDVVEDKQGSGADGVVSGAVVSTGTTKTLTLSRSNSLPDVTATWTDMVDDADAVIGNEYPTSGSGIAVSGRQVSVKVDNSTIKFNGSGQLYADVSLTESDPIWSGDKSNYYTKSNLNTAGTINTSSNPVQWTRLKGVPSGFADGTDHVNDADYVIGNEYPQAGNATSVSTRTVNVRVDNSSIKINSSNQLYAMPGLEMYAHTNTPRNILITFSGNSITGVYYKDGAPTGVTNPAGNG